MRVSVLFLDRFQQTSAISPARTVGQICPGYFHPQHYATAAGSEATKVAYLEVEAVPADALCLGLPPLVVCSTKNARLDNLSRYRGISSSVVNMHIVTTA